MKKRFIFPVAGIVLMAGCISPKKPAEPVVYSEEAMVFLEPGLRPEVLLFPEHFLMEDFELNQHGNIPQSSLVGGGLKTKLDLKSTMRRFNEVLDSDGWETDKVELGKKSFRTMASKGGEYIEIRAVEGDVSTEVFILYQPKPVTDSIIND
jgi:hypothetical protein